MHLDIFRQAEKLGWKKVISYPKRRPALPKATGLPIHPALRQFCKSKYHTDYLFTSSTKGSIFCDNSSPFSDSRVIHIAKGTKCFLFEENWTDCFTVAGTKENVLCYCTGDETMTWATLTAEHFLRWHSQDNSFALCCSMPNCINEDTSTR